MSTNESKSAWLFPGQGSQEVGMGRKLLQAYPRAAEILSLAEELSGLPLSDVMRRGPDTLLSRTDYVQPAVVALSCGYVDLMRAAGLKPDVVAGHSLGEFSALYAAGVLSINDTLRLAIERGRLMMQGACGGMIAVKSIELEILEDILDSLGDGTVCMANYNAPNQLVVSGDEEGLEALGSEVSKKGGDCVRLNVSGAWHSPLVAVAAHEFQKFLAGIPFAEPTCSIYMASKAVLFDNASDLRNTMMRQMTNPVKWYEIIEQMIANSHYHFYEVGPGKVLKGLMRRIIADEKLYKIQGLEHSPTIDSLVKQATALGCAEAVDL